MRVLGAISRTTSRSSFSKRTISPRIPPFVRTISPLRRLLRIVLPLLGALLLRADQEEVEDDEHPQHHDQRGAAARAPLERGRRGGAAAPTRRGHRRSASSRLRLEPGQQIDECGQERHEIRGPGLGPRGIRIIRRGLEGSLGERRTECAPRAREMSRRLLLHGVRVVNRGAALGFGVMLGGGSGGRGIRGGRARWRALRGLPDAALHFVPFASGSLRHPRMPLPPSRLW